MSSAVSTPITNGFFYCLVLFPMNVFISCALTIVAVLVVFGSENFIEMFLSPEPFLPVCLCSFKTFIS